MAYRYRRDYTARPVSEVYRAYQFLHIAFVLLPLIAGADKFLGLLGNWSQYLAPQIAEQVPRYLPINSSQLMLGVGIVEILAGIITAFAPRIGGWIVAVWLWAIIANLILLGNYYDIAVRDFTLSLGAIALATLAPRRAKYVDLDDDYNRPERLTTV